VRSLSATLLAAQKQLTGVPLLRLKVSDRLRGTPRLRPTVGYDDGAQPDDVHAAMGDSLYLHKVRVRAGRPQHQRVQGGLWGSGTWTDLNAVNDSAVICVATRDAGQRVMVLYNRGVTVYYRLSTDRGATFGAETTTGAVFGTAPEAVAFSFKASNDGVGFAIEGTQIWRGTFTAGAWAAWGNALTAFASGNGLCARHSGDIHLLVTGVETTTLNPKVWALVYGDGFAQTVDTWSVLRTVAEADVESTITFAAPSLDVADTHRASWVEKQTASVAYTRTYHAWFSPSQTFAANAWADPAPLDWTVGGGLALAAVGSTFLFSSPKRTLLASLAPVELVLTGEIVEGVWTDGPLRSRGRFVIDNASGVFALPVSAALMANEVSVEIGYNTSAGDEYSASPRHVLTAIEVVRTGSKSELVIETRGADYWLDRSRHRHTQLLSTRSAKDVLRYLVGRAAGGELVDLGASSRALNLQLSWAIQPDESRLSALERIVALLPDLVWQATEFLNVAENAVGDSIDYAFGTDHAIYRSKFRSEVRVSATEILAAADVGQAFDFVESAAAAPDMDRRRDVHGASGADATAYAAAALRQAVMGEDVGELLVPPHVGLEVGDVVAFDDVLSSPAQIVGRVRELRYRYERLPDGRAEFDQMIKLGGR